MEAGQDGDRDTGFDTQKEVISHIGHEPARGCAQQDDISIHADTEARLLVDPMSSNGGSVQIVAETNTTIDNTMDFLFVSNSVQALEDSVQEKRLRHSSPDRRHCSSAVQEPVFSITAATTSSTRHATDIISPGRRTFAAQVTVTRPATPASPASACQ